jgi:hypothetical protein
MILDGGDEDPWAVYQAAFFCFGYTEDCGGFSLTILIFEPDWRHPTTIIRAN